MEGTTRRFARAFPLIDAFLDPRLRARGGDALSGARVLVVFALFLAPLVSREVIQGLHTGSGVRVGAGCVFGGVFLIVLWILRCRGALEVATHILVGSTAVLGFVVALVVGAPAPLLGLSGLAFMALLVAGRRAVFWVPVIMALTLSVVAVRALDLVELPPLVYSPLAQAVDAAVVCVLTSGFAWMFVWSKGRLVDEVNEANAKLKTEVTEHCRAEDRALAASRAKSEFLANMSHEIRTPMTAIMGFADLLLEEDLSPAARAEHVEIIRRNGKHLLGLIDGILDLSKIEAGKMEIERIPCSPQRIAGDVMSLLRVAALAKGLSLHLVYATPIPVTIHSDPTRVRQILLNLVMNAVKFTAKGEITVTVRCTDPASPSPHLSFEVADPGPGIAPEMLARVFEPFTQADESVTRKFGGTGLGLAISARLARALGGGVTVSSTLGVGSTFTLTVTTGSLEGVELRKDEREAGTPAAPPSATRKKVRGRVLLAEDGPDNQALITAYLKRAGALVVVVENGRDAVDAALDARDSGLAFDLVLMDMQMPQLDGYAATRELRAAGYELPVVALTAHAMTGDRARCVAAGCDDYLTKPIVRVDLTAVLERYLSVPRSRERAEA